MQHTNTFPATSKSTNMYFSFICKEPSKYFFTMFITSKEILRCQHAIIDSTKCLDSHHLLHQKLPLTCPGMPTKFIKVEKPIHILKIPTAFSATSSHFHLPPTYQTSHLEVNISLDMANLHIINISSLDFCIWQHLEDHRNETQLEHLTTIPSILVNKIYQHMINSTQHIMPFNTADESTGDTDPIWTLFSHARIYVMAIGLLIPTGLGIFCCYFFWS